MHVMSGGTVRSISNCLSKPSVIRRSGSLAYPCAFIAFISFCAFGSDSVLAQTGGKSGCATQADQTLGQVLGGIAGGLAGNHIGKGDGNVAATISGVLLGGMAGGEVQKQMQKPDCKTNEKAKSIPKPKTQPKTQEATKPAAPAPSPSGAAPIATGAAATGAMATDAIADSPNSAATAQDQLNSTLQSQYAAAKAMYLNNANYRKRIDRSMTESLGRYDATLDRDAMMEKQFRDSGITTQQDLRISELRQWISLSRNDIASHHVELTDKLRELESLKRQQANEWNRLAAQTTKPAQDTLQNADATISNPNLPKQAPKVAQISAKFEMDDSEQLEQRKRNFMFQVVKAASDAFDENEKTYQDTLLRLQSDYPEFQDEIYKVLSDPNYRHGFAEDLFADSKARFLTDNDYRNSQTKSIQLALSEFDINAAGDTKNEQLFKAANFATRYDEPIRAIKNKINQERADFSNYLILGFDILKYTNLREWRIAEWNKRVPEQGTFSGAADVSLATQDIAKIVDTVITEDSKTWIMHRYDQHSAKNVKITKADAAGQPAVVRADFTYNQGERGWVELHYKGAKLSCLKFFDFPDRCRALGNSPSVDILSGLIMDMALDTGSSGSGGGGDFCIENPGAKQCGGGGYQPGYSPPAPSPPPISSFYGSNHTPW